MSLIRWAAGEQMCYLKEFGCNRNRYDPYEKGETPRFRNEKAKVVLGEHFERKQEKDKERKAKILIVEDDKEIRSELEHYLSGAGYEAILCRIFQMRRQISRRQIRI